MFSPAVYTTAVSVLGALAVVLSLMVPAARRDPILVAAGMLLATRFGILYAISESDSGRAGAAYSILVAACAALLLLRHPRALRDLVSVNVLFVLFVLWTGVSLLWAGDMVLALATVVRLWTFIAFGVALAAVGRARPAQAVPPSDADASSFAALPGESGASEFGRVARPSQLVLTVALCLSVGLSVLAPAQAYPQGAGRLAGFWNWNSAIGGVSSLVLVSALVWFARPGGTAGRARGGWALVSGLVAAGTLLLSASATWIAGTVAAVAVLALIRIRNSLLRLLIVAAGLFGLWAANNLIAAATRILDRDPTLTGRTLLWGEALTVISRRPWLGQGPGGLADGSGIGRTGEFHVHNSYLQAAMDYGFVGAGLLVAALLVGLYRLYRSRKYEHLVLLTSVLAAAYANSLITHPGIAVVIVAWTLCAADSPRTERARPRARTRARTVAAR